MNTVRIGFLCCLALLLASCANLQSLVSRPIVGDAIGKLRDAIEDIGVEDLARDQACELYIEKGRGLAEAAFEHEWPQFAPLWDTVADPAADMAYCQGLIRDAGAIIVTKKSDSGSASAVCFQAQFPRDFADRTAEEQAAITCHESSHLLEQKRVGCKDWLALYFGTISARLTFEGTAYALQWALLERYGWSKDRAEAHMRKRAERFPERYSIPREVISDECTWEHWSAIRGVLRERTGR